MYISAESNGTIKKQAMKTPLTPKETITATGVIIPVDWDEKGNPRAFAISTYEEIEYLIDGRNKAGRKLMEMNQQKIQVTGRLGGMVRNRRLLTVTRYESR